MKRTPLFFRHAVNLSLAAGLSLLMAACSSGPAVQIVTGPGAKPSELLAARELRRYLYQATGQLAGITGPEGISSGGTTFLIGTSQREWMADLAPGSGEAADTLQDQDFMLRSTGHGLAIIGGSGTSLLHGVYHYAENHLGVGFYLHGDVVPDRKLESIPVAGIDQAHRPLFDIRGILPFHDFPEGPDWWDLEGFKAILAQLPKLKMNFIGLHCYPQASGYPGRNYQAEPLVWIGKKEMMHSDGRVTRAYPALHFQTGHDTWGYAPLATSSYVCGAASLFEEDHYGASYMMGISPWPHTGEENTGLFNTHGILLRDAFSFAENLGIKTCIGTETPLAIPREMTGSNGSDRRTEDGDVEDYYLGLFSRIARTHPLDYYWLWTGENWTWRDIPDEEVDRVISDMQIAQRMLDSSGAGFQLATCGWVLGPARDRAEFDDLLPAEVPFSCINREVGWDYIEPAFAELTGRPKWAIPWLEDDPALLSPQLWAGRMRKDAVDALRYGCNGLIGIHWRTRNLSPNISALAQSAWEMGEWKEKEIEFPQRDLPAGDFYREWATRQFGNEVGEEVAEIFHSLDGGDFYDRREPFVRDARLFRSTTWIRGPGGIIRNPSPWEEVRERFRFIEDLEALAPLVKGSGNRERFGYWLGSFRFERAMAHLGCVLGELDLVMEEIGKNPEAADGEHPLVSNALQLREKSSALYEEVMHELLATASTTGELGMIANLENHNRKRLELLTLHDSALSVLSGKHMDALQTVSTEYSGPSRIILPVNRSLLEPGEDLNLKILVLSEGERGPVRFFWRPLGKGTFREVQPEHLNRGVYRAVLPAGEFNVTDLEYYLTAECGGMQISYPAGAPATSHTVVVGPPANNEN